MHQRDFGQCASARNGEGAPMANGMSSRGLSLVPSAFCQTLQAFFDFVYSTPVVAKGWQAHSRNLAEASLLRGIFTRGFRIARRRGLEASLLP